MAWEKSAQRDITKQVFKTPLHRYREALCLVLCTFISILIIQYGLIFLWKTFAHGAVGEIWKYQPLTLIYLIVQWVVILPLGDAGLALLYPASIAIFAGCLTVITVVGGWLWASKRHVPGVFFLAWCTGVSGSLVTGLLGFLSHVIASLSAQPDPLLDANWKLLVVTVIAGPIVVFPLGVVCAFVYLKMVRPLLSRAKVIADS